MNIDPVVFWCAIVAASAFGFFVGVMLERDRGLWSPNTWDLAVRAAREQRAAVAAMQCAQEEADRANRKALGEGSAREAPGPSLGPL